MLLELDPDTPQALSAHREVVHYHQRGVTTDSAMQLPCETPVALVYNGIAHSVMMCSTADLEDFAIGFSLSEGIIDSLLDIHDIEQQSACRGIELHITLANRCVHRLKEKRRTLAGRTGCGICGSESLEQVVRAQPRLPDSQRFAVGHIDKVLSALRPLQLLGQSTGRPMPPCTWMARATSSPFARTWDATSRWTSWWGTCSAVAGATAPSW